MGWGSVSRLVVGFLVCGAVLTAQDGGTPSEAFYEAIREDDLAGLQTLLESGANPDLPDPRGGATPLMYAAALGSVEAMKLLLDHKADVALTNNTGATALMWAATDIDKVRLLLSRGADARARSQRGRTALFLAARADESADIVRLLLAAGADVKATDVAKMTVLHSAAVGNDTATIRRLVDAGADVNVADAVGFTPLILAAMRHNVEAVRLLLSKGADVNATTGSGFNKVKNGPIALGNWTALTAAALGPPELARVLLDRGAAVDPPDVRGMTPLMFAIATDRQYPETIRLLLARGANVNARSLAGETPLDWARKIGAPRVIGMLERAGAVTGTHEPVDVPAPAHADLQTAVARSRTLLNTMSTVAGANGGCASCHSHNIVDVVDSVARARGLPVDEKAVAQRQLLTRAPYLTPANLLERFDPPGSPDTTAYALYALATGGYAPDRSTDAVVLHMMAQQSRTGSWPSANGPIARPPIEDGEITSVAIAIRAISAYGPPARRADIARRLRRARTWLAAAKPVTAEERNMQLLGLHWAGALSAAQRAKLAAAILAKQRRNGGWAQTNHLSTDAYATGQSLFALAETGAIAITSDAYTTGVRFLLSTQRADGSWYVSSRSPKFQPFFDGGFPYGHDQWISSMATGWAAAALTYALP